MRADVDDVEELASLMRAQATSSGRGAHGQLLAVGALSYTERLLAASLDRGRSTLLAAARAARRGLLEESRTCADRRAVAAPTGMGRHDRWMPDLSDEERAQLRRQVVRDLARTRARIAALERDFDDIVSASADAVRDDEHDPEGATIAFERAQVAALLADARRQLAALEQADERFGADEPGRCERCHAPIGLERLRARPSAARCVTCAARR